MSKGLAKVNLLLSLLLHTKMRCRVHWLLDYLYLHQELVLLVPMTTEHDIGRAVCYLYLDVNHSRGHGNRPRSYGRQVIVCRMVADNGVLGKPFEMLV